MPQHKSAGKRIRKSEKQRERNRAVRARVRTALRRLDEAPVAEQSESLRQATSELDNAVRKGVIKKNTANRKKSRLAKRVQRATSAAPKSS